jgi:acyl-CoA thioester hydrolase
MMFEILDLGLGYRRRTDHGTFVTETHNRYERELLVGERVRVAIQILFADDKRLHLAHEMFRLDTGERAATQELLFLHVNLKERRVTPFPPDLRARVHAAAAAHAGLPRPSWVGRHVGAPR